ncbi:hypothetical protein PC116_g4155 [Phytophthora cactorum]|nr:hypothetical protein PC116_g4155 [Phytophthora cactorum]
MEIVHVVGRVHGLDGGVGAKDPGRSDSEPVGKPQPDVTSSSSGDGLDGAFAPPIEATQVLVPKPVFVKDLKPGLVSSWAFIGRVVARTL